MAARTPYAAVHDFAADMQLACSCITQAGFQAEAYREGVGSYSANLNRGLPVALIGDGPLHLVVLLQYKVVEDKDHRRSWALQIEGYAYRLLDASGAEMFAYHWHPQGPSSLLRPHLHLGAGMGRLLRVATRAHLSTGPVALEDILRLVITEFGVTPRRADWDTVLQRTRHTFERQWPGI